VICSQPLDNDSTSVTNMAEYLAAEVIEEHGLSTPLVWVEHYPEHRGDPGEYSWSGSLLGSPKRFVSAVHGAVG